MKQYIIELTDTEDKALSTTVLSVESFINETIHNLCKKAIDQVIIKEVQSKLDTGESIVGTRESIILSPTVKTAYELKQLVIMPKPIIKAPIVIK